MDNLTVFVITCGIDPNYNDCIAALQKQTIPFKLDIIRDYSPMSAAFQEMLNRCTTEFFCQIDSDMIMQSNAIEKMYSKIKDSSDKQAMLCFKLHDTHLDKNIDGVKIYKHNIFKNYPYTDALSCEMEQLNRLEADGYFYTRIVDVIGEHSPKWKLDNIFERYYNYIGKYKKVNSENYVQLLNKLLDIYIKSPSQTNLSALLGAIVSASESEIRNKEKNYLYPIINDYPLIQKAFNINASTEAVDNRELILQVCGIPCAGRPYEINQLINTYSTKYKSRHILCNQYSASHLDIPYREFPYDILYCENPELAHKLITEAKIIHIHHKISEQLFNRIPKTTKVIYTLSNIGSSLLSYDTPENKKYNDIVQKNASIITTTDQPLQKKLYKYLADLSLPLVKNLWNINIIHNTIPHIVFAPTNKRMDDITGKGYYRTLGIIYKLQLEGYKFTFDLIEGVSYYANLLRKQKADIIIDDVINLNFHNTAIEGACFGAVVLTNYSDKDYPFYKTDFNNLEQNLKTLISSQDKLQAEQQKMLEWKKSFYTPQNILIPFEKLYTNLLNKKEEIKQPSIIEKEHFPVINPQPATIDSVIETIKQIQAKSINFWLIKESCLQLFQHVELRYPLIIGVKTTSDKNKIQQLNNPNIKVIVETNRNTKSLSIKEYNIIIKVPMPIIKYLETTFGKRIINDLKL